MENRRKTNVEFGLFEQREINYRNSGVKLLNKSKLLERKNQQNMIMYTFFIHKSTENCSNTTYQFEKHQAWDIGHFDLDAID